VRALTSKKEICKKSGLSKESCCCHECEPIIIDTRTPLLEARNINEISEKISNLLALVNYLRNGGFGAVISSDSNYIRIHPPLVEGCYWTQCRGCGYPFLVEQGKEADLFCKSCLRITRSKGEGSPRYYDDLFTYIDLNLRNKRIPTGYDSELPLTEEFCEAHSFDFEVIKARLNATGGYDPGEVLMNSMWSIPWFDKLPMKLKEEDG
jgi:hypothetical protein